MMSLNNDNNDNPRAEAQISCGRWTLKQDSFALNRLSKCAISKFVTLSTPPTNKKFLQPLIQPSCEGAVCDCETYKSGCSSYTLNILKK